MHPFTEEQMRGYVEGFKARAAAKEARRRELEARAKEVAGRCAARLGTIPEVTRVLLYGSLAKGSDIDLAVEGLPAESYFRTWGELDSDAKLKVDLRRVEELSEDFRRLITSYAQVLYACA